MLARGTASARPRYEAVSRKKAHKETAVGRVRRTVGSEQGQAMVEYALILSFVALVAFGVLATIGSNVVAALTSVSTGL
jgi:Flp pilus assembly pilin Flp